MQKIFICTNPILDDDYFNRLFFGEMKNVFEPFHMVWYDDVKAEDYGKADKTEPADSGE